MQLPFFYIRPGMPADLQMELDEENSRHSIQVLRMKAGDLLHLTDGEGTILTGKILEGHKKHCRVEILERTQQQRLPRQVTIGISLLKNASRFEWFLEKATELGVARIIPLICRRTEKEKFRIDRMANLCVSAMLQSRQCWLPRLEAPIKMEEVIPSLEEQKRFIAFCGDGERETLAGTAPFTSAVTLIGPEGDFSPEEISVARAAGFIPVTLGSTRLRSETAGIVAATLMMNA